MHRKGLVVKRFDGTDSFALFASTPVSRSTTGPWTGPKPLDWSFATAFCGQARGGELGLTFKPRDLDAYFF
jgi:hypothetical protein